ncbi:hypothetical protein [Pseudoalteromonas sp. MQS005]|uniref:hypothetical protein n=1 Tax=Pseudoalteromonas sp. MQS005 TaxID=1854052 RepID=UPI0007E4EA28|nr:hypothetical protein [Pseudoalteromonas sp. MQS005]
MIKLRKIGCKDKEFSDAETLHSELLLCLGDHVSLSNTRLLKFISVSETGEITDTYTGEAIDLPSLFS